jgi:hypothetical protein
MTAVARTVCRLGEARRFLMLYDTFEGMPPPENVDRSYRRDSASSLPKSENPETSWLWAKSSLESVQAAMSGTGYPAPMISGHWEGTRRAVDQYLTESRTPLFLHRIDYSGRIAVKPAGGADGVA